MTGSVVDGEKESLPLHVTMCGSRYAALTETIEEVRAMCQETRDWLIRGVTWIACTSVLLIISAAGFVMAKVLGGA